MMNWQPIETAPENTRILVWVPFDDNSPVEVNSFQWVEQQEEVEISARGNRRTLEKRTRRFRLWDGGELEYRFWMPIPQPPAIQQEGGDAT